MLSENTIYSVVLVITTFVVLWNLMRTLSNDANEEKKQKLQKWKALDEEFRQRSAKEASKMEQKEKTGKYVLYDNLSDYYYSEENRTNLNLRQPYLVDSIEIAKVFNEAEKKTFPLGFVNSGREVYLEFRELSNKQISEIENFQLLYRVTSTFLIMILGNIFFFSIVTFLILYFLR